MSERGQMLDGLEDTVNSLRAGSENMVTQVGLQRLQVLFFHFLIMAIGEEACCRAVDAKLVQFLIYSMFGNGCTAAAFGHDGEWKCLRKRASCIFLYIFERRWGANRGSLVDEAS